MREVGHYDFEVDEEEAVQVRCGAKARQLGWEGRHGDMRETSPDLTALAGFGRLRERRLQGEAVPIVARPLPKGLSLPGKDEGAGCAVVVGVVGTDGLDLVVRASAQAFGTAARPYRRIWIEAGERSTRGGAFPQGGRMGLVLGGWFRHESGDWRYATVRGSFAVGTDDRPIPGSLTASIEVEPSEDDEAVDAVASPSDEAAVVGRGTGDSVDAEHRAAMTRDMARRLGRIARQAQAARAAGTASASVRGTPATCPQAVRAAGDGTKVVVRER